MDTNYALKIFSQNQIAGIGPIANDVYIKILKDFAKGEKITLVNIICPGYVRKREAGAEHFDFPKISADIKQCPNVILMIKKMNRFLKIISSLGSGGRAETVMILADRAILNYDVLGKKQDVIGTLDIFFRSILGSGFFNRKTIKCLKMSELGYEFKRIPISGVKVDQKQMEYKRVDEGVIEKAKEYEGSLVFARINELMSRHDNMEIDYPRLEIEVNREVAKFVVEYGLAGKAIKKIYKNPILLFTEPSGYMRGYFYNAYLKGDSQIPVIYLK